MNKYDETRKADSLFNIIQGLENSKSIKQIEIDIEKFQNNEVDQDQTLDNLRKRMNFLSEEVKNISHYPMDII